MRRLHIPPRTITYGRGVTWLLIAALLVPVVGDGWSYPAETVQAVTESELKNQINETQNKINNINSQISNLESEQELIDEQIEDLNAEIINAMASISLKEEEISGKETEITAKQEEVAATEKEYDAAVARQEQQYADMVTRLRAMYENDSTESYLSMLLQGGGLSELLNQMDFVESIYEYDRAKQQEYEETKEAVLALWNQLEDEEAQLTEEKADLEADKQELESLKTQLDANLAVKKKQSSNYDAEIAKAQQEASVAKTLLKQEQQQLKELQAANRKGNTAAANATYTTTNYTSVIDNASGSDLGKKIAKYACQYIGNPYVAGGTSLTSGADCSGFTYRIYSDFGYSIPRTSYEQRSCGTEVSYSSAQPGDLICYDGHVALYIGGGLIVHASTQKTGIKVSNAQYRTILSVRRVI